MSIVDEITFVHDKLDNSYLHAEPQVAHPRFCAIFLWNNLLSCQIARFWQSIGYIPYSTAWENSRKTTFLLFAPFLSKPKLTRRRANFVYSLQKSDTIVEQCIVSIHFPLRKWSFFFFFLHRLHHTRGWYLPQRGGGFLDEQICGCRPELPRRSRSLGCSDHRSADERCYRRWCLDSAYNHSCLTCWTDHSSLLVVDDGPIGTEFFGSIRSWAVESSAFTEPHNDGNNHHAHNSYYVNDRKNHRETKIQLTFIQSC